MNDAKDMSQQGCVIDDVLITAELARRRTRMPDYAAENRALASLAEEMAQRPDRVLQRVAELAMDLCRAESAGISVLEPGGENGIFRWHAAVGAFAPNLHGTMPRDASPCATVIARNEVLLFNEGDRFFPALRGVEPRIYENLLAPWAVNGEPTGTIWVIKHTPDGRFDAEDARLLESLSRFASAAYQMVAALQSAKAGQQTLGQRVEERTRELSQANQELRASEALIRSLIEHLPGGAAFVVDHDLRYVLAGGEALAAAGFTAEDFIGRRLDEVLPPALASEYTPIYQRALAGEPFAHEHEAHGRVYLSRGVPLRNQDGQVYAALAVSYDITERRQAEETSRANAARLRLVAESARDYAIFTTDSAGKVVDWYPGAEMVFGYPIAEMRGQPADILYTLEDLAAGEAAKELQQARAEGSAPDVRWHLRKDGQRVFIDGHTTALRDAEGRLNGFLKIGQDVTERKRTEEALRESEARHRAELEEQVRERTAELQQSRDLLQATMDSSMDLIQVFEAVRDEQGKIVDFRWVLNNHTSESWYGEVRGQSLLQRNPGVVEEGIFETFKRVVETGKPDVAERHYVHEQFNGWFFQSAVKLGDGVATTTKDITDWKAAQEQVLRLQDEVAQAKLRESEQNLHGVANIVPDLLWYSEPDGSTLWYNHRWLEYTGQTLEEAINWGWVDVIHPDDRAGSAQRYRAAVEESQLLEQEHRIRRHDGEYRWFLVRAEPLRDEQGRVMRMYGAATDIHDQRMALEALRQSQERLQRAVAIETVGVLFFRLDGHIHDANDAFLRMSGYSWEELRALDWAKLTAPDHLDATRHAAAELAATGETAPYEKQLVRPDGSRWWGLFAPTRLSGSGTESECVEFIIDLTERKRAEEALRKSEERFRNVLNSMAEGFALFAPDFTILDVNDETLRLDGRSREQLVGRSHWDAFPGTEHSPLGDLYRRAMSEREAGSLEYRYAWPDGRDMWVDVRAYPTPDGDIAVFWRDSTERKRSEERLRESEQKYRTLFDSIDEGFITAEVLCDADGRAIDALYLEGNPAASRLTAGRSYNRKLLSDLVPGAEAYWLEIYARVVRTGVAERLERYLKPLDRWYNFYVSRVADRDKPGDSRRVAVVFQDITERKRAEEALRESEERHSFLLRLSDALRAAPEAERMAYDALALLYDQLGLDRTYIARIRSADHPVEIVAEVGRRDLAPMPGKLQPADFPKGFNKAAEGLLVVDDIWGNPELSERDRQSLDAIALTAFVVAPLRRGAEGMVWALVGGSRSPRQWRPGETALMQEAAERMWAAIERARAEEALRESEEQFRRALEEAPIPVIMHAEDGQVLQISRTWTELTGFRSEEIPTFEAWLTHAYGEGAESVRRHMRELFTGSERSIDIEFPVRTHTGEQRHWSFSASSPGTLRDGRRFTVGMAVDITERKRREIIQELLVDISADLSQFSDEEEIIRAVGTKLAAHLNLSCYHYVEVNEERAEVTIRYF